MHVSSQRSTPSSCKLVPCCVPTESPGTRSHVTGSHVTGSHVTGSHVTGSHVTRDIYIIMFI